MRSYEPPKAYIIWASPIGCRKQDITNWYFDKQKKMFRKKAAPTTNRKREERS